MVPLGAGNAANDRAFVGVRAAVVEIGERVADAHDGAGLRVQLGDRAGIGRRHLDDGLVGFDRDKRLIDDDMIAGRDMPGDDFGFAQSFAEIGQVEGLHVKWTARRAASTMSFSPGM
jgi:hypothetical protein